MSGRRCAWKPTVCLVVLFVVASGCATRPPTPTSEPVAAPSSHEGAPSMAPPTGGEGGPPPVTQPVSYVGRTEGEVCVAVSATEECAVFREARTAYWPLPAARRYEWLNVSISWTSGANDQGMYAVLYTVADGARQSQGDAGFAAVSRGAPPLRIAWSLAGFADGTRFELGVFHGQEVRPGGGPLNVFLGGAHDFLVQGTLRLVPVAARSYVERTGDMTERRASLTATPLEDGRVLIVGGFDEETHFHESAEVFDPATGEFTRVGSMSVGRVAHVAVRILDGRVLVVGGYPGLTSTEIFDPAAGTFSPGPSMSVPRSDATATLLPSGKVLVAGGGSATTETYDPRTGRFEASGSMQTERQGQTATLLPNGLSGQTLPGPKVLIAGGQTRAGTVLASTELYDIGTGTVVPGPTMAQPRYKHAAVALHDGGVLISAGSDERDWNAVYDDLERLHPNGEFVVAAHGAPRFKHTQAAVGLADGRVLLAGGSDAVESYDPATGAIQWMGNLDGARYWSAAALLGDGRPLIMGGYDRSIETMSEAWVVSI